jgi:hypothetical protein
MDEIVGYRLDVDSLCMSASGAGPSVRHVSGTTFDIPLADKY